MLISRGGEGGGNLYEVYKVIISKKQDKHTNPVFTSTCFFADAR